LTLNFGNAKFGGRAQVGSTEGDPRIFSFACCLQSLLKALPTLFRTHRHHLNLLSVLVIDLPY